MLAQSLENSARGNTGAAIGEGFVNASTQHHGYGTACAIHLMPPSDATR